MSEALRVRNEWIAVLLQITLRRAADLRADFVLWCGCHVDLLSQALRLLS